ncbi:MAG: amidohydrolase [Planctomycetota bacterium]|nr:MAG: amidohydrolase [Planctomycetota bacterium]
MFALLVLSLGLIGQLPPAEGPAAGQLESTPASEAIEPWLERQLESLVAFYQALHREPELSFHEVRTSAKLADVLEQADFQVSRGIGGHGVVGVLENGSGPRILLRCDMDALPIREATGLAYASQVETVDEAGRTVGVMHACGHDIHMTVWTGTVQFLSQHRDLWSGTLVAIAQPAEERGAGARAMLADGLYTRFGTPDFCLALHVDGDYPAGTISFTPGFAYANVDSVDIRVLGKGGHGSAPHTTHDPVALAGRIIMGLQTLVSREIPPQDAAVVTVGSIHGGSKHNIIPEEVSMQLTVRSYTDGVREKLLAGIERIAKGEAKAAGFPPKLEPVVTVQRQEFTPASYNDPALVKRINRVFVDLIGKDHLFQERPSMGGEDFGRYAKAAGCPGYMFGLGSIDRQSWKAAQRPGALPLPSLHTKDYAPVAELTVKTGVSAMVAAILELAPTQL